MLRSEDDLEVQPQRKRGWTIAAIARYTGRSRKTVGDTRQQSGTHGLPIFRPSQIVIT